MSDLTRLKEIIKEVVSLEKRLQQEIFYFRLISDASARIDNILLQIRAIPGVVIVNQQAQVRMSDVAHRAIDVNIKAYMGSMSKNKYTNFLRQEVIEINKINSVIIRTKDDLVGKKDDKKIKKHIPKPKKYEPILQDPEDIKDLSHQITPAQPDTMLIKHDIKSKKPVFIKGQ
jgi:hypothetical protein